MTITREQLALAARAAGLDSRMRYCEAWNGMALYTPQDGYFGATWSPLTDHGQLLDLAMACKINIDPLDNVIIFQETEDSWCTRRVVDCQDFTALSAAVITAAAEQQQAKETKP